MEIKAVRKRWLLGRPRAYPPTPLDEAQTPNPPLAFTQLWRSADAPAGPEGAGSLCSVVPHCRCRVSFKLQKSELLRTPPAAPLSTKPPPHHHHCPQADTASTWCGCSGPFFGLEGRSFRSEMLGLKEVMWGLNTLCHLSFM